MRIVRLNYEIEETCPTCKCVLAFNPKDLEGTEDQYYVMCPNCGRGVHTEPPKWFIRKHMDYFKSLININQPVGF